MAPLLTVVLALVASLNVAGRQNSEAAQPPLPSVTGVVKQVTATTVTVTLGRNEVTFNVDSKTRVIRTAHTNDLVLRNPGRAPTPADYVKSGDRVIVKFRQDQDVLTAVELRQIRK
jgi:Cu/Ag efflux protein CusF